MREKVTPIGTIRIMCRMHTTLSKYKHDIVLIPHAKYHHHELVCIRYFDVIHTNTYHNIRDVFGYIF